MANDMQLPFSLERPNFANAKSESQPTTTGGDQMKPLDSLWGTVITGLVLTLILYVIVRAAIGA